MEPIYNFLLNGILPSDKIEAAKLRQMITKYYLMEKILYRKGYSTPFLQCLYDEEVDYALHEIHEEVCVSSYNKVIIGQPYLKTQKHSWQNVIKANSSP